MIEHSTSCHILEPLPHATYQQAGGVLPPPLSDKGSLRYHNSRTLTLYTCHTTRSFLSSRSQAYRMLLRMPQHSHPALWV